MVGVGQSSRLFVKKLANSPCSHTTSFDVSDVAMYSASVVDRGMHS